MCLESKLVIRILFYTNVIKKFYVSPFIAMKTFYNFRLSKPGEQFKHNLIKQSDVRWIVTCCSPVRQKN